MFQISSWAQFQRQVDRKRVVLCCRAQHIPSSHTTFLGLQLQLAPSVDRETESSRGSSRAFLHRHASVIESPLYSGLVLDIIRSAPYLDAERQEIIKDGWGKEVSTCEKGALPSAFNYNVMFKPECVDQAFSPDLPPNPFAAHYIQSILTLWKSRLEGQLFYPRCSSKMMSYSTLREWEEVTGIEWERRAQGEFSQKVLEHWQHEYRRLLFGGICELRQKWYRSGLVPRTYFAQGSRAYNLSKYCQEMANELTEIFLPTNYVSRLNPTRLQIHNNEDFVRIWDLSTFTSNHHESRHFLMYLADFCHGTKIRLFDTVHGVVEVDLGRYLSDYAQLNTFPAYSLERFSDYYKDTVHFHNVAGFLGVFGNLAFSTFLHAASIFMVIGDIQRMNVAGDDGHAVTEPGSIQDDQLERTIRRNGVVEDSKYFWTYEDGAICLKRGLVQIGRSLHLKEMIIWPSIALLRDYEYLKTPGYDPIAAENRTIHDVRLSCCAEITRFMVSLHHSYHNIDDFTFVLDYLANIYTFLDLDPVGNVPQLGGGNLFYPLLPRHSNYFELDPVQRVISTHYHGAVMLPSKDTILNYSPRELIWAEGYEFFSNNTKYLGYMELLGYLEREEEMTVYTGAEGLQYLLDEFSSSSLPAVYKYRVLSVPDVQFQLQ